jgi:voltage-gated potassium channel
MLIQLILATAMAVLAAFVHLVGLAILMRVLRFRARLFRGRRIMPLALLYAATVGAFVIHALEIWLYAFLYLKLDAFSQFEQALYFSVVTYSTLGYGDLLMPHEWRILGATEAPVGVIMLGWSTAFLISLLVRLRLVEDDWLAPAGDDPNPTSKGKP